MIKKVEHIGIAVKDLKKSENLFEKLLDTKPYKKEEVKSEGVVTSFFKIADQKIELLHASSKNSPMLIGASAFFVFFSNMFKLCHVQIVCVLPNSFLSPKNTPTSRPILI